MNRFFLPPSAFQDETILFPPDVSTQIARVLRLTESEHVVVLDNLGSAYEVQLDEISAKDTRGTVIRKFAAGNEPRVHLTLLICLTQREKFEWILQKGTELGVSAFLPVLTSRTLVQKLDDGSAKTERWLKILKEAAEQSERGRIPVLLPAAQLKNALASDAPGLNLILNADESQVNLVQALKTYSSLSNVRMLIGPEGGFSTDEVQLAQAAGYISVRLGPRILRMETAAIAAVAVTMAELGEME